MNVPGVILALALAPGLGLLWWFYHKDYLEPEPLTLVFSAFAYGAVMVVPAGFVEKLIQPFIVFSPMLYPFLGIALVEEGLKWYALKRFIARPECDECYDGIVYGTSVALGFATLENFMYLTIAINPWAVAGWRAVLSVPLHALCGVLMGYEAGRQKMTEGGMIVAPSRVLIPPVLAHGLFNLLLFTGTVGGVGLAGFLVFFLWIKGFGLIRSSRTCS